MDRHKLWRRVAYDYEQLKGVAPEGYEPTVWVFLAGRSEPIELGFVETRRGEDDPWVRFGVSKGVTNDVEDVPVDANDIVVHVHEKYLERVEVVFRQIVPSSFGFVHRIEDSRPDTSAE